MILDNYGLIINKASEPYVFGTYSEIHRLAGANRRNGHTTEIIKYVDCDGCSKRFPAIETIDEDLGRFHSLACYDEAVESHRADTLDE